MIYIAPRIYRTAIGWDLPAVGMSSWKLRVNSAPAPAVDGAEGDMVLCWGAVPEKGEVVANDWQSPMTKAQRGVWERFTNEPPSANGSLLDRVWRRAVERPDPAGLDTAHPILPDRGMLRFVVGGEVLRVAPAQWPRLNAQKERLRAIYEKKQAQGADPAIKGIPPDHYRKWAGSMKRRLRLSEDATLDVLTRSGKERIATLRPATLVTETFPGSSSTLGGDETWTEVSDLWENLSGNGQPTSSASANASARCEAAVSSDNHTCKLTLANGTAMNNTTNSLGPAARYEAAADTAYLFFQYGTTGYLQEMTGSSETRSTLSSDSLTLADDDTMSIVCAASGSLDAQKNDVSVTTATDTTLDGNTLGGMFAYRSDDEGQASDWSLDDGVSAAGGAPVLYKHRRMAALLAR